MNQVQPVYPFVFKVCEDLDLKILDDIKEIDEVTHKITVCVSIGARAELEAGLRGCVVTPCFNSMNELEAYCQQHYSKVKSLVDKEQHDIPDGYIHEWEGS